MRVQELTQADVRKIWVRMTCSNCPSQDNLAYDNAAEMMLCRHCRMKRTARLRELPAACKLDRQLALAHMVVPGTHIQGG